MSSPLLLIVAPALFGVTLGIGLVFATKARVAGFALAAAAIGAGAFLWLAIAPAERAWAPPAFFVCLGCVCGAAGPLAFGRTPVGVLAAIAAAVLATYAGMWALFALTCAVSGVCF